MTILTMSQQEINRLEIIMQVDDKRITRQQAGELLDLSVRQVQRLLVLWQSWWTQRADLYSALQNTPCRITNDQL